MVGKHADDPFVPAAPLIEFIARQGEPLEHVAARSGVSSRRLRALRYQRRVRLGFADDVVTALGAHLIEVYPSAYPDVEQAA